MTDLGFPSGLISLRVLSGSSHVQDCRLELLLVADPGSTLAVERALNLRILLSDLVQALFSKAKLLLECLNLGLIEIFGKSTPT